MIVKNRILVTGPPKSGKTTFVEQISDSDLALSSVFESDGSGDFIDPIYLDYGELSVDDDRILELYATPGQRRFKPVWHTLSRKALGLVVLLDGRRPDPLGDMQLYMDNFNGLIPLESTIILVNRREECSVPLKAFAAKASERKWGIPIVPIDVRLEDEAFYAMSILMTTVLER